MSSVLARICLFDPTTSQGWTLRGYQPVFNDRRGSADPGDVEDDDEFGAVIDPERDQP
jgi:hypothetical protein